MKNITFNGYDLQTTDIVIKEISHENIDNKTLNIQKFSSRGGGKLNDIGFDVKKISLSGIIKKSNAVNLETAIDELKRQLNYREKNLDLDYLSGTRRYKATCSVLTFERNYYTIDAIDFRAEFIVSDPAWGMSLDTSTLAYVGLTDSSVTTSTLEYDNIVDYTGTIRPFPKIQITLNTVLGIRRINFENTNEDGFFSRTRIEVPSGRKFQDGDVIIIDTDEGTVQLNGEDVEFGDGFPKFSLTHNDWTLKVVGESYDVDVKLIYYSLWL